MLRELIDREYLVLDEWLVRATKGLSRDAANRIAEDIREHYEESVASLIKEGYRPGGAELEAIKRLGSPYKARRSYRREYPTVGDMQRVHRFEDQLERARATGKRPTWREWFFIGCLAFVACVYFTEGIFGVLGYVPAYAFAAAAESLGLRAAVREADRHGIQRGYDAYLRGVIGAMALMTAYMAVILLTSGEPYAAPLLAILLFFIAVLAFGMLKQSRKIRLFLNG
jgi:hypothetical protein